MNPKFSAWAAQRGFEPGSAEYVAARDAWDAALSELAEALPQNAGSSPAPRILLDAYSAISNLHTWSAGQ